MIWTDNDYDHPLVDQENGRYMLLFASLQHVFVVLLMFVVETILYFCMIWTDNDNNIPLVNQEKGRCLLLR